MAHRNSRQDRGSDRRTSKRFAIQQEILYKILDHRSAFPESGSGKTLDISSGGMLFETKQRLRAGKRVEVSVNWPAMLDGACPLKLVALGRVVRAEDNRAAMHIEQHEFRTRRNKELPAPEAEKPVNVRLPYY